MEQPMQQPAPQPQQPVNPAPQQQAPQPSSGGGSKIWLWIIGGCLGIVIIIGLVLGGLAWWGARKVKNEFEKNKPKIEQFGKEMEENSKEWEAQSKKMQEEFEKMQNTLPQNAE